MSSLKEVAEKVGVSVSVVSKNSNENLFSTKTKKKVQSLITELNLKHNKMALQLCSKVCKRNIYGFSIPDIQKLFNVDFIKSVEDYFFAKGYNFFNSICIIDYFNFDLTKKNTCFIFRHSFYIWYVIPFNNFG